MKTIFIMTYVHKVTTSDTHLLTLNTLHYTIKNFAHSKLWDTTSIVQKCKLCSRDAKSHDFHEFFLISRLPNCPVTFSNFPHFLLTSKLIIKSLFSIAVQSVILVKSPPKGHQLVAMTQKFPGCAGRIPQ